MFRSRTTPIILGVCLCAALAITLAFSSTRRPAAKSPGQESAPAAGPASAHAASPASKSVTFVNAEAYNAQLKVIANLPPPKIVTVIHRKRTKTGIVKTETQSVHYASSIEGVPLKDLWPAKAPLPRAGALLPFDRIIAYYGNLYSRHMGVLGEYPPEQMLAMLKATTLEWQAADPTTRAVPALDYIAVAAQGTPGGDGRYRLRMSAQQIDKVLAMAQQIHAVVFLDVQVGLSNVETEVPRLAPFLKLPQVELALDPEFAMRGGHRPGTVIGTLDASDVNWAAEYLAQIVRANDLPPKILVVHRFTQPMVTNYRRIHPLPEVQIVMDMDGFGYPSQKIGTYLNFIQNEPVQFTGFKLFFKNDVRRPGSHMLTPQEILKLTPRPSYIQYQ